MRSHCSPGPKNGVVVRLLCRPRYPLRLCHPTAAFLHRRVHSLDVTSPPVTLPSVGTPRGLRGLGNLLLFAPLVAPLAPFAESPSGHVLAAGVKQIVHEADGPVDELGGGVAGNSFDHGCRDHRPNRKQPPCGSSQNVRELQPGIFIWSDLTWSWAMFLSMALTKPDVLEKIYIKPDIYIYVYFRRIWWFYLYWLMFKISYIMIFVRFRCK